MNRAIRRAAKFKRGLQTQIHRHVDPTAGLRVLHNARPYEEGEMAEEHIKTRAAFERLRDGQGDEEDFDRVSMMLNIGLVRAEDIGNGELLVQTMQKAQDAMVRVKARYLRGLRFGFDADGLASVPAALDAYETIMDASSPKQMKLAIQEAYGRISNGDVLEVTA